MIEFTVPIPLAAFAALQPAAPPPPPLPELPQYGQIQCDLVSQSGATRGRLTGVFGPSELRPDGTRRPQVTFSSDDVPEFAGVFEAQWTLTRGIFSRASQPNRQTAATINLLVHAPRYPVYRPSDGAMTAEYHAFHGLANYFAGFCEVTFSRDGRRQ